MISHYGLFWSERDVFWGRPNNQGQLLGRVTEPQGRRGAPTAESRHRATDFRDFIGLYSLYGDGELIYVGEAGLGTSSTLFSRLKQHRKGPMAGRWDRFSWFGCVAVGPRATTFTLDALAQLEATTIAIINPGFNKQSGTFKGATQVFQVPSDLAEGDIETKLARMAEMVARLEQRAQ